MSEKMQNILVAIGVVLLVPIFLERERTVLCMFVWNLAKSKKER